MNKWSEPALLVWEDHYIKKSLGEKTPGDVNNRIVETYKIKAEEMSNKLDVNKKEYLKLFKFEDLRKLMNNKFMMFNTPVYYNLGVTEPPMTFGCWVNDIDDSMEGIMDMAKDMAIIFKYGGGMGSHIGALRPKKSKTECSEVDEEIKGRPDVKKFLKKGGKVVPSGDSGASGPVSFMKLFNAVGDVVKSGGRRRAAILFSMRYDHPDIMEFITCKTENPGVFDNMNISVMHNSKVIATGGKVDLQFDGFVWETIDVDKVLYAIAENTWKRGDPGLFFDDKINEWNFCPELGPITSSNPCGEEVINNGTSCNLASINLYQIAKTIDWDNEFATEHFLEKLDEVAHIMVPFMDLNIDISLYPTEKFETNSKIARNIGLGIAGFAEFLFLIKERYGSKQSQKWARTIMKTITAAAYDASIYIGITHNNYDFGDNSVVQRFIKEKLCKFPDSDSIGDVFCTVATTINSVQKKLENGSYPINRNVTTIAPTGNTGIAMDAWTGGMEPAFEFKYKRRIRHGEDYIVKEFVDPEYEKNGDNGEFHDVFIKCHAVPYKERIAVQEAFQKYTTASISSTINVHESTSIEEIYNIYVEASKANIKGITIFRDKSLDSPIMMDDSKSIEDTQDVYQTKRQSTKVMLQNHDKKRPTILPGSTYKIKFAYPEGSYTTFIIVNEFMGNPIELFINTGKSGSLLNASNEALGRVISLYFKSGGDIEKLIETMIGIKDGSSSWQKIIKGDEKTTHMQSIPDAIAKILHKKLKNNGVDMDDKLLNPGINKCQREDCESTDLDYNGGCVTCRTCGWSKCG